MRLINYQVEDIAQGASVSDRSIFVVPAGRSLTLTDISIISQGAAAGIDADNTCTVAIKNGANVVASDTFNAVNAFPVNGTAHALGALDPVQKLLAAGAVVRFSVTNGATANPPAFMLQITGVLTTM